MFSWNTVSSVKADMNKTYSSQTYVDILHFQYIFKAIASPRFPRIFDMNLGSLTIVIRYDNMYNYTRHYLDGTEIGAFVITDEIPQEFLLGGNLLQCKDASLLSVSVFYYSLNCNTIPPLSEKVMNYKENTNHSYFSKCSSLVYKTHRGECQLFYWGQIHFSQQPKIYFHCENGTDFDIGFFNDLIVDCKDSSDEPLLQMMYHNHSYFFCNSDEEVPCHDGHPKCFNISDICVFQLNEHNVLQPCRMGEHLQECSEFECNMMFKCPHYFCVSWAYICNGEWNCPGGYDEHSCGPVRNCIQFFKCKSSGTCVHLGDVCDNKPDCPYADDEQFCVLHGRVCVSSCACLTFAIDCRHTSLNESVLSTIVFYNIITISDTSVNPQEYIQSLGSVFVLNVLNTNFSMLCPIQKTASNVAFLNLNRNNLTEIPVKCFPKANSLRVLQIVNNHIIFVHNTIHTILQNMLFLNISNNPISSLTVTFFSRFEQLKMLSVLNFTRSEITGSYFVGESVQFMETSDYLLCCLVEHQSMCSENKPWYFACSSLFRTPKLRVATVLFIVVNFVSNVIHLVLEFVTYRFHLDKNFANGSTVSVIILSDILLLLPLAILVGADLQYGISYGWNQLEWKQSLTCKTVYVLFALFYLVSPTTHVFYAFSRGRVVSHPINTGFKKTIFVVKHLLRSVLLSVLLAGGLSSAGFLISPIITCSFCFPFIDPTQTILFSAIFSIIFAIFLTACAGSILVIYASLIISLTKTQKSVKSAVSRHQTNRNIYLQIIVLVTSYFLCWIPSGAVFTSLIFVERYPVTLPMWIVVVLSPTNSLMFSTVLNVGALRKFSDHKGK